MSVETWGLMPKSQIDDEKVEEAVDRIVGDHNNDPDAHLEVGQSLTTHRAAEIIDHIVGSVVADKLSHQEEIFFTSFDSIAPWTRNGTVSVDGWPGVNITVEDGGSESSDMVTTIYHSGNFLDYSKNMLIQLSCWHDVDDQADSVFGLGIYNDVGDYEGFGFEFVGGVLKGYWGNYANLQKTAEIAVDVTAVHVYRAQYVAADETVYFFIDGQDAGTITIAGADDNFEPTVFIKLLLTGNDTDVFRVRGLLLSRQP